MVRMTIYLLLERMVCIYDCRKVQRYWCFIKGDYTYKIEYEGRQYYILDKNIRFDNSLQADALAENIRKIIYEQSMLADFYMYGVSKFDFDIVENGDVSDVIELTREQLMDGKESVEEALKAIIKKEKEEWRNGRRKFPTHIWMLSLKRIH